MLFIITKSISFFFEINKFRYNIKNTNFKNIYQLNILNEFIKQ